MYEMRDRYGNPCDIEDVFDQDLFLEQRCVCQECTVPFNHFISTVYLGVYFDMCFETMVFCHHDGEPCGLSLHCDRYPDEGSAMMGHERIREQVRVFERLETVEGSMMNEDGV